jgi:hypothetical protein
VAITGHSASDLTRVAVAEALGVLVEDIALVDQLVRRPEFRSVIAAYFKLELFSRLQLWGLS